MLSENVTNYLTELSNQVIPQPKKIFEIFHTYRMNDLNICERVYKTPIKSEAVTAAKAYLSIMDQNDKQFHSLKINGKYESIKNLALERVRIKGL